MKQLLNKLLLPGLTACAIFAGAVQSQAQTTVSVDSNRSWQGYMNVFGPNYSYYAFGSGWGAKDLRAYFDASGTNYLTLTPNTNVFNPTDTYWANPDGTGAKLMDASFYVQDDSLAGQTLTFNGTCLTNSLVEGYNCTAFIKVFAPDYSGNYNQTAVLVPGQPFSITLTCDPGTHVQYGFETQGNDVNPTNLASVGLVAVAVNNADPSLPNLASQTAVEGQAVTFSTKPVGTSPFSYQWSQVVGGTPTPLVNGGRFSGVTSNSLTISNLTLADAGTYSVTVTNVHGSASINASLVVVPLVQVQTNMLVDPSFESAAWGASASAGWANFNGAVLQSSSAVYYNTGTPISIYDGSEAVQVYTTGANSYNGFYQDRPAAPGQVFTAGGNFYVSSLDPISGANICFIEIQFRDAGGNVLRDCRSSYIGASSPQDTWFYLAATNILAGDFTTPLGSAPYLVAPANTATVRSQVTYFAPATAGGSVYADMMNLRLRATPATAALTSTNLHLSFSTLYGPTYKVLYKTNLTDAVWQTLTSFPGDGSVKTVNDAKSIKTRFYIVNTQ